jgi:hypothetical protein
MSPRASKCAWFENKISGATYTVLLAIADVVNDPNDNRFWMSMTNLGERANMKRQTASRAVKNLEELGWLEIVEDHRSDLAGKPSVYRFTFKNEPEMLRSKLSPGVPDLVAPSENGVHDPSSEVPDLVAGVPDPSSRGAMRSGTNTRELNLTKTTTGSAENGTETKAERDKIEENKINEVVKRTADKIIGSDTWRTFGNGEKRLLKEMQDLRPRIREKLSLSGNGAPPGDMGMLVDWTASTLKKERSAIRWEKPSKTKELAQ